MADWTLGTTWQWRRDHPQQWERMKRQAQQDSTGDRFDRTGTGVLGEPGSSGESFFGSAANDSDLVGSGGSIEDSIGGGTIDFADGNEYSQGTTSYATGGGGTSGNATASNAASYAGDITGQSLENVVYGVKRRRKAASQRVKQGE